MSLIHLLLLHNVIRSTYHPYTETYKHKSRRRTEIKEVTKKNPLLFATESGISLDEPLVRQCINQVLQDPEMDAIVGKYSETLKQLCEKERKAVDAKLIKVCPIVEESLLKLEEAQTAIKEIGFDIKSDRNATQYVVKADTEEGYDFEVYKNIDTFNDRTLTREDILSGRNKYQEELEQYMAEYPNNKENVERYQQEYDALSKKKFALILKKNREELETLEYKINKYQKYYTKECRLREKAEFYANITEDDKLKIIDLFDKQEAFANLCDRIHDLKTYSYLIAGKGIIGREDDYQYMVSKRIAEAQGKLLPSEQQKINSFCQNLSQKLLTASNEELNAMKQIDRYSIDKSPERMFVYKTLCVQTKENCLAQRYEQERNL